MKRILSLSSLFLLFGFGAFAQSLNCNVQGVANPTFVCLGDSVLLSSSGSSLSSQALDNNFNDGTFGAGWSASADGTVTSSQCVPAPNGTPYLWMGDATPGPRILATNPLNVSSGGTITFLMRYSIQSDPSPCEGPDLASEGVYLQYSTDNGANWITINYWSPNGGNDPVMTSWTSYSETVPVAAQTATTMFRWAQLATSGNAFDHWGLDEIAIGVTVPFDLSWSTGQTGGASFYQTPVLGNNQYIVYLTSATDTCMDTVNVMANPVPVADLTALPEICAGSSLLLNGSGSTVISPGTITQYQIDYTNNGSFDYTGIGSSVSNVYNTPGNFTVHLQVTSTGGCTSEDLFSLLVNPTPNALFTMPDTICGTLLNVDGTPSNILAPGVINAYNWDFNNDGIFEQSNAGTNPTNTFSGPGNFTVNLVTTTANGCSDTISHAVSVNTIPNAAFTINPNPNCNQTASFNASSSTGQILHYIWDFTSDGTTDTNIPGNSTTHTFPGPGTYNVNLITSGTGSCSDTISIPITVFPVPVADFTMPSSICGNTITPNGSASNVSAPSNITSYNWDFNNDGIIDMVNGGANPTNSYASSGLFTVALIVQTNNGCTDTITHTVDVNSIPAASVVALPAINCNTPVTFNATSSVGQITSYNWDFTNDGVTDQTTTGSTINHTYPGPGTYTLALIVNATGSCTDTILQTVVINPVPAAGFTFPNAQCLLSIPFNASSSSVPSPSTIATYSWDFNGDGTPDATVPGSSFNNTFATNGTFDVTLTVTTNAGCTNSITQQVTVFTKPTAAFSVNPQPNCDVPANFDASASSAGGNNINSYGWDYTNNGSIDNISATATTTNTYPGPGTYTATLYVVSDGNCSDTLSQTVVVNPPPTAVAAPVTAFCGISSPFSGSGSSIGSPGSISSYNWDFDNNGSTDASGANVNHTFPGPGTYTVTLTTVSNAGCNDQSQISVTLLPVPTANFQTDSICLSELAQFTNQTTSNGGNPVLNYDWTFGDSNTSINTDPTHTYASAGTYTVTMIVTTDGGCSDTVSKQIVVSKEPIASFEFTPQCFQVVDFNNTSNNNGTVIANYDWQYGNGENSGTSENQYEYPEPGTFTVSLTITTTAGCKSTATNSVTVKPSATLSKLDIPNVLTPNGDGINDILVLDPDFEECLFYEIHYFNRWGNRVYVQQKGDPAFPAGKTLEPGVFFYVIKAGTIEKNGNISLVGY